MSLYVGQLECQRKTTTLRSSLITTARCRDLALASVLQPQKHKTDERDQHVRVEDDSRISRSKIALRNHLMDVNAGRA